MRNKKKCYLLPWVTTLIALLCPSCSSDYSNDEYQAFAMIARFSGKILSTEALEDKPIRLALMWKTAHQNAPFFVGNDIDVSTDSDARHYPFTFDLMDKPPDSVLFSPKDLPEIVRTKMKASSGVAVGTLVVYEDLNKNGRFDRKETGATSSDDLLLGMNPQVTILFANKDGVGVLQTQTHCFPDLFCEKGAWIPPKLMPLYRRSFSGDAFNIELDPELIAEFWGEKKKHIKLALSSGRYLVQRRAPGKYGATEVSLTFGGKKTLSTWSFQPFTEKLLALKGGKLVINRHELNTHYGFLVGHKGNLGQRLTMGYGYRLGPSTLNARVQLGMSHKKQPNYGNTLKWVGADVLGLWHYPFGPLTSRLGLGASVQYRSRSINDKVFDNNQTSSQFFTLGPMVEGNLDVYLNAAWSLNIGLTIASLFYHANDQLTFTIDNSIWLGMTWGL